MTADMPRPRENDRLDADLTALFAVRAAPAVLVRLDDRVQDRLRGWAPSAHHSRLRPGRRAGLIGLLAATLAVGGATGRLQALYDVIWGPFDIPWNRGAAIAMSQVVDGYRVTIDRAYADATRLALAISVVDELERPGTTQVQAMYAIVTDESGEYGGVGATSSPDGPFAAVNVAWKVPAALPLPAGPRTFHVVVPHIGSDPTRRPRRVRMPSAGGHGGSTQARGRSTSSSMSMAGRRCSLTARRRSTG